MTAPLPDDLTNLGRWALDDGFITVEEVLARWQEGGDQAAGLGRAAELAHDGRVILAELRDRGLTVRLGADGRPRVGARHKVDDADLTILAAHWPRCWRPSTRGKPLSNCTSWSYDGESKSFMAARSTLPPRASISLSPPGAPARY